MGLGFLRTALIAGGTAAEIIRKEEREREKGLMKNLTGWIDNVKPRADEYLTKATQIKRKARDNIEQVVSKYFGDETLTDAQKVRGAVALLADHGNKIENIDKAFQSKYTYNKVMAEQFPELASVTPYSANDFVKESLMNLSEVKTNITIDEAAKRMARVKMGDFNYSTDGVIKANSIYGGLGIFNKLPSAEQMESILKGSLPAGVDEYRGPMRELAPVKRAPTKDNLETLTIIQNYKLNDAKIKKYLKDASKDDTKPDKYKISNWLDVYKNSIKGAADMRNFKGGKVSFTEDGQVIFPQAPTGSAAKTKYEATKQQIFDVGFYGLTRSAIFSGQTNNPQFLAAVGSVIDTVSKTRVPLINPNEGITASNIDKDKLTLGAVYIGAGRNNIYIGDYKFKPIPTN
tara:strand:- start:27 stop:1235 length:1209 start_codon:yes stop_codon:yes gene_type:complete